MMFKLKFSAGVSDLLSWCKPLNVILSESMLILMNAKLYCFTTELGNPRGNENPMLLAMGVIWFRNHNWHARRIQGWWDQMGVHYNDEILFNRARQWNIAEHQVRNAMYTST